jgi:hypothetical protein
MTENPYEEVETLRDADGVLCVITRRKATGHLSFRLQKEFESQGEIRATAYLGRRHIPGIERIVKRAADRIDILTEEAKLRKIRQGS